MKKKSCPLPPPFPVPDEIMGKYLPAEEFVKFKDWQSAELENNADTKEETENKPEKIRIVSNKGEKVEIGWNEFREINKKIPLADECDLEELAYGDSDFQIYTILSYHNKLDLHEVEVNINILQKYIPIQMLDDFWNECCYKPEEEK